MWERGFDMARNLGMYLITPSELNEIVHQTIISL